MFQRQPSHDTFVGKTSPEVSDPTYANSGAIPKASTNSSTGGNQPSPLISSQPAISNPPSSGLDQLQPSQQPPSFESPVRAPENVAKDVRHFVHGNDIGKGIDQDMEQAAAEMTSETTEKGTLYVSPFDPNLVCPMCMKQHRYREIQLFRAHVGKCDSDDAPFDPNLVCPMCMKQHRHGEIQLFRAHVGKCDGTDWDR